MVNKVLTVVVFVPLAVILVTLAVANRAPVDFTLDPFNPGSAGLTLTLPLFVYLFAALVLGLVIGSLATWFGQGRYRKLARRNAEPRESEPRRTQPAAGGTLVRADG